MDILKEIARWLEEGDEEKVYELTRTAIEENIPAPDILDKGLIAGMKVVGKLFRDHEIFLPDVLMAARAMYAGLGELKPLLVEGEIPTAGKVVLGTVEGDIHDIGKNLVGIMLEGAGFQVIDIGKNQPPARFIEAAQREGAVIIGMSALLTTTMPVMKRVTQMIREQGLKVKTMVGGAPVTEQFAREIDADAYAGDASRAVDVAKQLAGVTK